MTKLCVCICCTAKACMLLEWHRMRVRRDVDSGLLIAAKADLVLTSVSPEQNPKSDFSSSGEVKATAKVHQRQKSCIFGPRESY